MKMEKMHKKTNSTNNEAKTVTVRLKRLMEFTDKKGASHVCIFCEDDWSFSNYMNVWNKQPIDIDVLKEGSELKITYVAKEWNGKVYNNFTKVEFKSPYLEGTKLTPDDLEDMVK